MVIAAGAIRYNLIKFLIADGLAALVSGGMFLSLGYWFGNRIDWLRQRIKGFEHILLIVAGILLIGLLGYFWWRKRKNTSLTEVALARAAEHVEHATPRASSTTNAPPR